MNIKTLFVILAVASFVGGIFYVKSYAPLGGAAPGTQLTFASSSSFAVGQSSVAQLFSSNTVCQTRVIGTAGDPIYLRPTTGFSLEDSIGFVQAASTTVVYDAEEWGCGTWYVKGMGASTTIVVAEFR